MTNPPGRLEPSIRDLINAAHPPTWWEQPDSERLEANKKLLGVLCDQLAHGKVDRDLALYFRALFECILAAKNPGKDAGRVLGLVPKKGAPKLAGKDDRDLAIAVAVQQLVNAGKNEEDAWDEVARRFPGKAGDDVEGRHLSIETVRDAYRSHKIAAKATIAFEYDAVVIASSVEQYFAALRWEDDGGSVGSHETR